MKLHYNQRGYSYTYATLTGLRGRVIQGVRKVTANMMLSR